MFTDNYDFSTLAPILRNDVIAIFYKRQPPICFTDVDRWLNYDLYSCTTYDLRTDGPCDIDF